MPTLGIISDTHGLLRPEALAALRGVDQILHAGDIGGTPDLMDALSSVAPVTAIRGNIDKAAWAQQYPEIQVVQFAGKRLYLIHDLKTLAVDPAAEGYHVVVSGHSHKPSVRTNAGVLYVNPGSAGPRRFKLPVSVARLQVHGGELCAQVQELAL